MKRYEIRFVLLLTTPVRYVSMNMVQDGAFVFLPFRKKRIENPVKVRDASGAVNAVN